MSGALIELSEATKLIESGEPLMIAADEALLAKLPRGNWVGGTIPYFIDVSGGVTTREKLFVTRLGNVARSVETRLYGQNDIANVYSDGTEAGFSLIVLTALSPVHLSFAMNAPQYENFGTRPLVGWIAGVHLDDIGKVAPKVYDGVSGQVSDDGAVVMRVNLPEGKVADAGIVNIFELGEGPALEFEVDGFEITDVIVDGQKKNFADYIAKTGLDVRLPLVADYQGARINVSFQSVDEAARVVHLYAPVFKGVSYRHAKPVGDYVAAFNKALGALPGQNFTFACNCILNFLYGEMEGKKTGEFTGPITFGEVAYQLVNQTFAYVNVLDAAG